MFRVGCSGYDYAGWRGEFYPAEMAKKDWFAYYASRFDTVELNSTFYRLPTAASCERWRERAPGDFLYAVKLSRYGTHRKRLRDPDVWLPNFLDRVGAMGATLGPILVQLPPRWGTDAARLDAFLGIAGRRHRWAVEVRDPSWLNPGVYRVLRDHDAALCVHDLLPDHPRVVTAAWTYLRFHGPHALDRPYDGRYGKRRLAGLARWICDELAQGHDAYAYFNNDIHGDAPRDATTLAAAVRELAG